MISKQEAQIFLNNFYKEDVSNMAEIFGGKHSQAFSYMSNESRYVLRINVSNRGFEKDEFVYRMVGESIPIPKILETGSFNDTYFYCISEYVEGETVRTQYKKKEFTSFEEQFTVIEKIAKVIIPNKLSGYGEWEIGTTDLYETQENFIMACYVNSNIYDWKSFGKIKYYEKDFVEYLISQIEKRLPLLEGKRHFTHGDFGNDNLILKDGQCKGVIDWERSRISTKFLDVGRVVLFCPRRNLSTQAAIDFYKKEGCENYKDKILFGVYYTMLNNYAGALTAELEDSCKSSWSRIKEIETVIFNLGNIEK